MLELHQQVPTEPRFERQGFLRELCVMADRANPPTHQASSSFPISHAFRICLAWSGWHNANDILTGLRGL